MSVPGVVGTIDRTRATGDAMIPEIYSRAYRKKLYDRTIASNITNTDHTGEVKSQGDTVVINTIPDVTIGDYYKGKKRDWEHCTADPVIMRVNRASDFNVVLDDVDKAQFATSKKDFLQKLAGDATKKIAIKIDTDMLGSVYVDAGSNNQGATAGAKTGFYNLGTSGAGVALTKTNILDIIHDSVSSVAMEANMDQDDLFIVLPTWAKGLINVSDYKDASMTGMESTFKGGKFGKIGMFTCYETNLYTPIVGGQSVFPILFGSRSATAFVSQLASVQYFDRLEATNGSGIAGLNVYDWKVINPELLGVLFAYRG